MKQCTKCLLMLPLSRFATFSARGNKRARLASWCHDCTNHHRKKPEPINHASLAQALTNWSKK